LKDIIRSTADF